MEKIIAFTSLIIIIVTYSGYIIAWLIKDKDKELKEVIFQYWLMSAVIYAVVEIIKLVIGG